MPDTTHDFLIDLIATQDDSFTDGFAMEPHLIELILDRQAQASAAESALDTAR